MLKKLESLAIFETVRALLQSARERVVRSVNATMVATYFEIGRVIVEYEQQGKEKAIYGAETLKQLSQRLNQEFGRGFSGDNLQNMRQFFLVYEKYETVSRISQKDHLMEEKSQKHSNTATKLQGVSTLSKKFTLSWSHYVFLMRMEEREREFYERESNENSWSLRELRRQFDSALFERIVLSRNKQKILTDNLKKYHTPEKPEDVVKDPYVLEFLGLREEDEYTLPKNGRIFSGEYKLYLPTKKELREQVESVHIERGPKKSI